MKIGMVSPYDFAWPGGVNAHVTQLSAELRERGHSVRVIAPYSQAMSPAAAPAALSSPSGIAPDDEFIPMGRTVPLAAGGSTARVTLSWWLYPRVRGLLARERFDVLHLHEPLAPLLPLLMLHHSNAVNIGTFHAYSHRQRLYRWTRPALGRWQRRLHGRIAVSPAARAFVAPHFPRHTYRVIPNGIDYARFADARPLPQLRADGRINILFVGRQKDERKGLRYLLAAFARLRIRQGRRDLRLVIVGPGQPDRESARILAQLTAADAGAVLCPGAVSDAELPRYYAGADVFCSPATGGESFGIVLLEAMAAGAPVVASDIDGYRDIIAHGDNGLLAAPRAPDAIAAAILQVADNPALAARLRAAGRRAAAGYRWPAVATAVENYYQHCIEEAKSVGAAR